MTTVLRARPLLASVAARGSPRLATILCGRVAPRAPDLPPPHPPLHPPPSPCAHNSPPFSRPTRSSWDQRRWNSGSGSSPPRPDAEQLDKWYKALGLRPGATRARIQAAWVAKVRVLHTDHDQSRDLGSIQDVNAAKDGVLGMDKDFPDLRTELDGILLSHLAAKEVQANPADKMRKMWEKEAAEAAARKRQQEELKKASMNNARERPKPKQTRDQPDGRAGRPSLRSQVVKKASLDSSQDARPRSPRDAPAGGKKAQASRSQTPDGATSTRKAPAGTQDERAGGATPGGPVPEREAPPAPPDPAAAKSPPRAGAGLGPGAAAHENPRVVRIRGLSHTSAKELCNGSLRVWRLGRTADVRAAPRPKEWDVEFYTSAAARKAQFGIAQCSVIIGAENLSAVLVNSPSEPPPGDTSRCLVVEDPDLEVHTGRDLLRWESVRKICRRHGTDFSPVREVPGAREVTLEFASWRRGASQVKASIELEKLPGVRVSYGTDPWHSKIHDFLFSASDFVSDDEKPSFALQFLHRMGTLVILYIIVAVCMNLM